MRFFEKISEDWMESAVKRPGKLHERLGIPQSEKIPMSIVDSHISALQAREKDGKTLSPKDKQFLEELEFAKRVK